MTGDLGDLVAWWAYVARFYAVRTWRDLPGPTPVKVALVAICLAIPGPADELALVALASACRALRSRRASVTN